MTELDEIKAALDMISASGSDTCASIRIERGGDEYFIKAGKDPFIYTVAMHSSDWGDIVAAFQSLENSFPARQEIENQETND